MTVSLLCKNYTCKVKERRRLSRRMWVIACQQPTPFHLNSGGGGGRNTGKWRLATASGGYP